jgi:hypothetical protein
MALNNGHIEPVFPYLNDVASTKPEANFFSQILLIESILGEKI